jgi:formylglycine-generating enzyme required for sulfatase activity
MIGSAEYVAPEQMNGKAVNASDLYSLGVTCLYLLTGISPFDLFDVGEHEWIWRDYLVDNLVSDDLVNILDKLVIFGTKRRYQEVKDVLGDLGLKTVNPQTVTQIQVPPPIITIPASPRPAVSYPQALIESLPGGIKLEMVILPEGSFTMGSDEYGNEQPKHQVTLKKFAIGKYPVTQEQYQAVMGHNPSKFKDNPKNPVEKVSWNEAQAFCQKLNEKTGKKYRLPSESEWEYACRAGTQTLYSFGDDEKQLGEYAWYKENSGSITHPVGQKKPNNWGLYDMHGNVWEWCEDCSHKNYENAPDDGSAWNDNCSQTNHRVMRGGSWFLNPWNCRSAYRFFNDYRISYYGFRVVSLP